MNLLVLHLAEDDLWNSVTYYEEQQSGLVLEFETEIRSAFTAILKNPNLWPLKYGNYRKYILPRFPFNVWYEVLPNTIRIIAVAHQKRKPNYWTIRKSNERE